MRKLHNLTLAGSFLGLAVAGVANASETGTAAREYNDDLGELSIVSEGFAGGADTFFEGNEEAAPLDGVLATVISIPGAAVEALTGLTDAFSAECQAGDIETCGTDAEALVTGLLPEGGDTPTLPGEDSEEPVDGAEQATAAIGITGSVAAKTDTCTVDITKVDFGFAISQADVEANEDGSYVADNTVDVSFTCDSARTDPLIVSYSTTDTEGGTNAATDSINVGFTGTYKGSQTAPANVTVSFLHGNKSINEGLSLELAPLSNNATDTISAKVALNTEAVKGGTFTNANAGTLFVYFD